MSLVDQYSGRGWGTHRALACAREVFPSVLGPSPKGPGNGKVTTSTIPFSYGEELWAARQVGRNCFSLCSHQLSLLSLFRFLPPIEEEHAEEVEQPKPPDELEPSASAKQSSRVVCQRH